MTPGKSAGLGEESIGIDVVGTTARFSGFTLGPLTFSLRGGERVALLGANGAGKSTLLRILSGRLGPTGGRVVWNGRDMGPMLPEVRARVGLLPEGLTGFGWMRVDEHLRFLSAFYPSWDREYATTLLDRLELSPAARLGTLSRGMQVKLSFVAAEAYRPPLLLLDEPTSGLDPIVRHHLLDVICEAVPDQSGRIVLVSTHLLEDAERFAGRVLALAGGQLRHDVQLTARGAEHASGRSLLSLLIDPS